MTKCIILLLAVVACASPALADVLVLTDGRTLIGEVVEQTRYKVRFRTEIDDIWSTLTFDRGRVLSLDRVAGDQSDRAAASAGSGASGARSGAPSGATPASGSHAGKPADHLVAVIPLHGQVGGMIDDTIEGTFDAAILQECLIKARDDGAELVVLDIRSGGGLVDEMERICETIIGWRGSLRIIALVEEAYSAAAIIALSCRELAVRPRAQIGAAVIIQSGRSGFSAVDAKFASPHHARQRKYMAASGQPYEVVQAMSIMPTELWWSKAGGFRTEPPPGDDGRAWEQVDSASTVLTMSEKEAVKWGLAKALAPNVESLVRTLGLNGEVEIRLYDGEIRRYARSFDHRFEKLTQQLQQYFESLGGIAAGMSRFPDVARAGNRTMLHRLKSDINRHRNRALSASRQIGKTDRSLLSRRIKLGEDVMGRLEEDKKLIAKISHLLEAETVDDFNEAVDRINQVIEGWNELLRDSGG